MGRPPVCLRLLALALPLLAAGPAAGTAEEADALARAVWFEGVPPAAAAAIGPEGCAHWAALLSDPAEARTHGTVVEALGLAGCDGAFEALAAFEARAGRGEVGRAAFRALRGVPAAMGHLAARDDRALGWLLARTRPGVSAAAPAWSHRQHRGARLARDRARRLLRGLALSGRPAAAERLEALGDAPAAAEARELLRDVRARGRDAVLGGSDAREIGR